MPGFHTSPIDLLWALVIVVGYIVFAILRRPGRSNATLALLALGTIVASWVVFYVWAQFKYGAPSAESAFDSVDVMNREVRSDWIVNYIATDQGWIPGLIVFGIAWGAARLWPRRAPG